MPFCLIIYLSSLIKSIKSIYFSAPVESGVISMPIRVGATNMTHSPLQCKLVLVQLFPTDTRKKSGKCDYCCCQMVEKYAQKIKKVLVFEKGWVQPFYSTNKWCNYCLVCTVQFWHIFSFSNNFKFRLPNLSWYRIVECGRAPQCSTFSGLTPKYSSISAGWLAQSTSY